MTRPGDVDIRHPRRRGSDGPGSRPLFDGIILSALARGVITALFFLAGCASQVPPSGGPPDTTPPEILATYPEQGTLNFYDAKLAVRFSEYVDRRSFQESVFLSPSAGTLRFEWGADEVEILFGDSLKGGTTYIVTIGTDLKDTRNNSLDSAFSFAFSTGDVIDSCAAGGKIYDEKPGGVMVFTYRLGTAGHSGVADTVDPRLRKPDYLTQSGVDGTFRIPHMKPGRYRVIAVRDVFKNLLYDVQTDAYGMCTGDILLTPESREKSGLICRLTVQDTVPPFLSGARATDNVHIQLRFNEAIDPLSVSREDVVLIGTAGSTGPGILDVSQADTSAKDFRVTTSVQDSAATYRITLRKLVDRAGNAATGAGLTALTAGSAVPDTVAPLLTISVPGDSVKNVHPADPLRFSFSEAVDTLAVAGGLTVTDADGDIFPGALAWQGRSMALFVPGVNFTPGAWYGISLILDSLRDLAGNGYRDSMLVRHFRITEEKDLGSIAGVVSTQSSDGGPFDPARRVFVSARNLSARGTATVITAADSTGVFSLGNLREGMYMLSAFEDADSNGQYSSGLPFPVIFSERYSVYPETLKVRPRWPLEGVNIRLPR